MELLDCEGAAPSGGATLFCGGVVGLTVAAADDLLDRGSIIAVSSSLPGAKPELCPPPDTVIKAEDAVIFVAETSTPKATPRAAFIIFANGLPELTFRELMTGACGFRDVSGADDAVFETALGVRIRHVHGDAADVALLRRIVMNIPIETAIVLGTNARARWATRWRRRCATRGS
ncbi:hypothetical protein JL721_6692 [Aureococcus anophagefferens]|nr:hypothetical protein JL721_6692 [Aureococcus anophagefferens]